VNSEKVWLICFANLHFIKLHFCTMSTNMRNPKLLPVGDGFGFLLFCPRKTTTCYAGGKEELRARKEKTRKKLLVKIEVVCRPHN